MFIKTFPVGAFQCNCTIVADPETKDAFVIDPGDEAQKITEELTEQGFNVRYILHTHAHIDHIGATKQIKQSCGGEICLHKDDMPLYDNMKMQADFLGVDMDCNVHPITQYIDHKDVIECHPDLHTQVLHTPGHTPGSVCFYFNRLNENPVLFSGDTLFLQSIGRTDLWGGDTELIKASIKEKLYTLPAETLVVPGHGRPTRIGHEQENNPFVSTK